MDKTIRYTENILLISREDKKESTDLIFLQKLEDEYGKDFKGEGFSVEKYKQNDEKHKPSKDS